MAENLHPPAHPATAPQPGHAQADDINVSLVAIIGIFSAVGLFLVVVLLQAYFYAWSEEEQARKGLKPDDPAAPLAQMVSEQQGQLNSYHWIKPETQTRAIPIARAMELVAAELAAAQKQNPQLEANHASHTTQ